MSRLRPPRKPSERAPSMLPLEPTVEEAAALIRAKCGAKIRRYGLTTICDYPPAHPGPHRGGNQR